MGIHVSWELQDFLSGTIEDGRDDGGSFLTGDELDILAAKLLSGRNQARSVRNDRDREASIMLDDGDSSDETLRVMDEAHKFDALWSELYQLVTVTE